MSSSAYTLQRFVGDLRAITLGNADERQILTRVQPLMSQVALSKEWLLPRHYEALEEQGNGVHLLHEEPDHTLAIVAVCWLPGRETPPHNHGTWSVVAGVEGSERNVFWRRRDDGERAGYAELEKTGAKVIGVSDLLAMPTGTIHSVANDTMEITLTLHVYGRHLNFSPRSQFDLETRTESPRCTVWREG